MQDSEPAMIPDVPQEIQDQTNAQAAERKAAQDAAEAALPIIQPIGPPPGVDASEFTVVEPGTPASPTQEAGGYANITSPSEAQRLENERMMREAAGPSLPENPVQ